MSRIEARDLWSFVERRAAETPSRPLAFDEHDRPITFGEFHAWAERVAAGLYARGVGIGDRVVWIFLTRIEALVLTAALARLGCVQIPLIPASGARELGFVLRQARPAWAIVPGHWNGVDYPELVLRAARGDSAVFGETNAPGEATHPTAARAPRILRADPDLPEADPAGLDAIEVSRERTTDGSASWIFYTSGTTSDPKGTLHSDATLLASAVGLDEPHAYTPDDRVSLSSSPGPSPTPGPLQIRTRRFPPSGSSADVTRGYGPQIRTRIRGVGCG